MPKKGFRFDDELDEHMAEVLSFVLDKRMIRGALSSFAFLDEATAGKHQAMTAFMLGYLYSDFNTYYELAKGRGPTGPEQQAFTGWLTGAVVPLIESTLTEYEKKRELK